MKSSILHRFHLLLILAAAALLLTAPFSASAQKKGKRNGEFLLTGRATDSATMQGIAFASVQVTTPRGDVLGGTICDSIGNFRLSKLPRKQALLTVLALGYTEKTVPLSLDSVESSDFYVGEIPLSMNLQAIDQVTVEGKAPFLMLKPNRKVLTPQAEDVASGATMTDLLKRLPDFEVVSPASITLRGAAFRVLINGKPSGLSSSQLNTINMNEIESIEIITTPSVRYRANDLGGVVNINLKRFQAGVNSVLQAAAGSDNCYSLSASANVGLKRVNFFGALYGGYEGAKNVFTFNSTDDNGHQLEYYLLNDRMNNFTALPKVGIDYVPTQRDAISVFWVMDYRSNRYTRKAERTLLERDTQRGESLSRNLYMEHELNAMYTHTFNDDGLELSISAVGGHTKNQDNLTRRGLELGNGEWQSTDNKPHDFFFNFSTDMVIPLPHAFRINAGVAADVAGSTAEVDYSSRASDSATWAPIESESQRSASFTQVYGAYADFAWEVSDKVSLNAGIRYEHYRMRSHGSQRHGALTQCLDDVFFSGGFSYTPVRPLIFSLSYSGRVDRPVPFLLNPTKTLADFYNEFFMGNPLLTPAYSHGVELSMAQRFDNCSFHEDVKWTYVANPLESYSAKLNDSTWVKSTVNLKQERNLYVGVGGNWDAASWCSVWFNAHGQGVKSQSKEGAWLVNDEWNFSARLGLDFPINSMWIIDAWGGYTSGRRGAFRHYKGTANLNAGVYFYPLRNKNLILILQGINLLATNMNYTTRTDGVTANWDYNWQTRSVYLSVFWRLGDKYRSISGERFNSSINSVGR